MLQRTFLPHSPRLILAVCLFSVLPLCAGRSSATEPQYPLAVAAADGELYVVDLDLPGVWKVDSGERLLFVQGSKRFRTPLNRPRSVALHPGGGILIGDSATREIYHVAEEGGEPKPLTGGHLGIAMALAVSPDGETLYAADAEMRRTVRLPIDGGEIEPVADVNARGLAFDDEGTLWAVTPDDAAVYRIDTESKNAEAVITGRPYSYPNGLAWSGGHGFVSDGYGKAVWRFSPDGTNEKWVEGDPLVGPVGIAAATESLWVADPKAVQVFEFDLAGGQAAPRL